MHEEAFKKVLSIVSRKFPEMRTVAMAPCPDAEENNAGSDRQFMHTGHETDTICYAEAFKALPLRNIYGLMFHEFGHLITIVRREINEHTDPDEAEMLADVAIFDSFGLEIAYEGDELLQALAPEAVDALTEQGDAGH